MTAFGIPSGWEIWIVLGIAVLLFGSRIPSIMRSLGSGIHELKNTLPGPDKEGDHDAEP